jgi:regulator of protease activity HflC (stomatin/prohibitin superfamily)
MIALGAEFVINFVLDFYRPRAAGEVPRPAFDSRFLAIFSETAGIAKSIAEAINYQFGFEVSKTWFYLLIKRSIVPLILFGAVCLVAITSLSVVDVGQRGVIERFGRPFSEEPIGAGMTVKYPWPIERTYRFDVGQSRRIVLGFAEERPHRGQEQRNDARPVLWTNREHGEFEEIDILVATPRSELRVATDADLEDGRGRSVPVSIFRAVATVEFRVRDVFDFGYQFSDGTALVKGIAQRELVRYAASVDQEAFLSVGRSDAAKMLQERIQSEAERLHLGVEILFVRLLGIHPAQEVAEAYQKVVGAEQQRDASTQDALRQRNEILASAVGAVGLAERLAAAIREADALSRSTNAEDRARLEDAEKLRDELMQQASGEVSKLLADAYAARSQKVNKARGDTEKFRKQLVAYRAAPTYFEWMKYFDTLGRRLADARKYVLGFDPKGRKVMLILNTEEEERIRFESQ